MQLAERFKQCSHGVAQKAMQQVLAARCPERPARRTAARSAERQTSGGGLKPCCCNDADSPLRFLARVGAAAPALGHERRARNLGRPACSMRRVSKTSSGRRRWGIIEVVGKQSPCADTGILVFFLRRCGHNESPHSRNGRAGTVFWRKSCASAAAIRSIVAKAAERQGA